MTLSHYSDHDTLTLRSQRQADRPAGKPDGLWVSVDGEDDWPAWCRGQSFRDTDAQHHFHLTLADNAKILRLTNPEALDAFTRMFGHMIDGIDSYLVNWGLVATVYQGIIIAPYQWTRRLALGWYYGWDCASGCIWDPTAIAGVELIHTPKAEVPA